MAASPRIKQPGADRIGLAPAGGPFGTPSYPDLYQETGLRATAAWSVAAEKNAGWTLSTATIYSFEYNVWRARRLPDEDRDPGPHHLRGRGRRRRDFAGVRRFHRQPGDHPA